jgi:TonB family protein
MRFSIHVAGLLFAAFAGWAASAAAQTAQPLIPPVARGSIDVAYPPGAEGDAVVLVDVVVETDGTVSDAVVVNGVAPFDEQARRAVLGWRFAPARRGDTPVRARIRARIVFRYEEPPEAPNPAPVSPSPSSRSAASAPPPPDAVAEVVVLGARREIGQATLSSDEVREMPGAFGDPFRAIDALPGVVPAISGIPYFFIRGAPPTNNGYYVDGIRVPLLFHLGIGAGVLHPGLVERIDFHPGAAPARFGRFAGATIAAATREPAAAAHGQASLRLFDAGALLEAPFASGRGSALAAGRYGYPGPIVGAFSDTELDYWDYQARATWNFGSRDRVGVFAFGSHDYLATGTPSVEQLVADFHRVDVRYDHSLIDGNVRIGATVGHDSMGSFPTYVKDRSGALRLEVDRAVSDEVRLRGGADVVVDDFSFEQRAVAIDDEPVVPSSAFPPPTNVTGGVHADVVWRLTPRVELVPGARIDVFASSRANGPGGSEARTVVPAVDPRLAARVILSRGVAWLSAVGLSHQYPVLRVGQLPAPLASVPGFPAGSARLQTVAQTSHGMEFTLPESIVLSATGFLSGWSGLTDLTAGCVQLSPPTVPPPPDPNNPPPPDPYFCPDEDAVNGRAYGIELAGRRAISRRLSGFVSYTLSRSTREAHFLTLSGSERSATVASEGDRTHVLNAAFAYDLGRRWRFGARFLYLSGTPYSDLAGSVPVPPYNNRRTPPFVRLDVRLEKRWMLGKEASIAFVVEGQNVTLSREVSAFGQECEGELGPEGGTNRCTLSTVGPITIPSVGVEAFF